MVNLKPYVSLPFQAESTPYTIGISTKSTLVDQRRNNVQVLPGYHTVIKVIPQLLETNDGFNGLDVNTRQCKLNHEVEGIKLANRYTRSGCEAECAIEKAVSICKCLPWYLTNNLTDISMCNMFSGYCFGQVVSDEKYYKGCPEKCIEDCNGMHMTVVTSHLPINLIEVCKNRSFLSTHFLKSSRQHFPFKN